MAAPTFVQLLPRTATAGATSLTATFGSTTSNANLIVVQVRLNSASTTVTSVSDNTTPANTYTQIDYRTVGTIGLYMFYAPNITGRASHQVTVQMSGSVAFALYGYEINGADTATPLDTNSYYTNSSGTTNRYASLDSTVIDTTTDVFVVAGYNVDGKNSNEGTPGSGFTESIDVNADYFQYQSTATALTDERGSYSTGSTRTNWIGMIASFKAAAAAGGHPLPQRILVGPTVGPFRGPF